MRALALALALLTLALPARSAGWVGAYVWGGVVTQSTGVQRFYDTVRLSLAAGFDTIRIAPGPSAVDGNIIAGSCPGDDNLACYSRILFASSVWDHPNLKRIMLTAIDRKCQSLAGGNQGCLTASTLTANKVAIKAEYAAMFTVLRDRFAGRSIQFILSNWEGDNFVFCGSAYDFGRNAGGTAAANCQATFPSGQTNVQRVQAHLLWHSYRDEAVAEFIAANPGFNLINAPEVITYNLFNPGCGGLCNPETDTILKQIALAGGRPYCSWSSYDAQGPANGAYLAAVQDILATACQNLIIGEAGFDLLGAGNLQRNVEVFKALDQIRNVPGVLGVIPWNAVDPASGSQKFGMFDTNGKAQLLPFLGPIRPTPQPAPIWK